MRLWMLIAVVIGVVVLVGSVVWCVTSWSNPQQFTFLPYGDVLVGFRSCAGRLEWGENAGWEQTFYSYWSIPWAVILVIDMVAITAVVKIAWWSRKRHHAL